MSYYSNAPLPATFTIPPTSTTLYGTRDTRETAVDQSLLAGGAEGNGGNSVVSAPLLQALTSQGTKFYVDAKDLASHFHPEKTKDWTVSDLYDHLLSIGVPKEDCRLLRAQQVDGTNLLYVNDKLLEKWGVDHWGRRNQIIKVLQSLVFTGDMTQLQAKSFKTPEEQAYYERKLRKRMERAYQYAHRHDPYSHSHHHHRPHSRSRSKSRGRYVDPFAPATPLHAASTAILYPRSHSHHHHHTHRTHRSRSSSSSSSSSSRTPSPYTRSRSRSHSRSRCHSRCRHARASYAGHKHYSHKHGNNQQFPSWAQSEREELRRKLEDRENEKKYEDDYYGGLKKTSLYSPVRNTSSLLSPSQRVSSPRHQRVSSPRHHSRSHHSHHPHHHHHHSRRYYEDGRDERERCYYDDQVGRLSGQFSYLGRDGRDVPVYDGSSESSYYSSYPSSYTGSSVGSEYYDSDEERVYYHPRIHGYHHYYRRQLGGYKNDNLLPSSSSSAIYGNGYNNYTSSSFNNGLYGSGASASPTGISQSTLDFYRPADVRNKSWLHSLQPPSTQLRNNPSMPEQKLKLEWVYGYRSFDSRNNLFYNAQGDIVYPAAAVVVVYKSRTRQQRHFQGHNDEVRCLTQHPINQNIFASGQNATFLEDAMGVPPHICVWDSSDFGKNWILKLTKEDRAIRALSFSTDGKYLISVSNDNHHTLKIWEWETRTLLGTSRGDSNPIYAVKCNPRDPTEFVTVGKHHAIFWRFDGVRLTARRPNIHGKNLTFYSIAFSEKGYICLGCENGGIYVFANGNLVREFPRLHRGKIFALESWAGGLISGGGDGIVHVLDKKLDVIRSFQFHHRITSLHSKSDHLLIGTQGSQIFEIIDMLQTPITGDSYDPNNTIEGQRLEPVVQGHYDGELHAVCISPGGREIISAGEDNLLCIWEMTTHRLLRSVHLSDKPGKPVQVLRGSTLSSHPQHQCARAVGCSPNGKHIMVGLNNGEVSVFSSQDLRKLYIHDLHQYSKRHANSNRHHPHFISSIKYSPSGNTVAIATHGAVIVLMDVRDEYRVKGVLQGHDSFVTQIDWSEDGQFLQSTDGQYHLLYHHIDENDLAASSQIGDYRAIRDVKWANQQCLLGWNVQGILETGESEGYLINSLQVAPSRQLVVSGDDMGSVQLFRFPVLEKGHASHAYKSHASHVLNVAWACDEKYVISVGGPDLCIMQWSVI